jgi:F0F1-type ATP synthase membrane subunit c/vacuolar-type H+-ATPase subunit K
VHPADTRALPPRFRSRVRILYLIFAAFVHATFLYALIVALGLVSIEPPALPVPLWVPVAVLSVMTIPAALAVGSLIDPSRESDPDRYFARVQQKMLLQAALYESIAFYGLIGGFFGLSRAIGVAVIAASTFLILSLLPGLMESVDRLKRIPDVAASPAAPTSG